MIDEIDYFPKRDKYKKKKGGDSAEEWDALKKVKTGQDTAKGKPQIKPGKEKAPENKKE
ncbi:MAG: hypothetical protein O3A78_10200 [Nitrospinae bacterium]|jgi:hypothetical protein|nr:hypothetical protein [Nitrospinota bacterium]MDA1110161.1 hypothetical protein [Nitrospinota bacterium]